MDIQDTRRANLAEWLKTHSVPRQEKSLFSQLKKETTSFGEKVARRLESDYGMAVGYLDRATEDNTNSENREEKPPLSGEAERLIAWVARLDATTKRAPEIFRHIADILALAHNGALADNASTVPDFSDSDTVEVQLNRRSASEQHAPRKKATKAG